MDETSRRCWKRASRTAAAIGVIVAAGFPAAASLAATPPVEPVLSVVDPVSGNDAAGTVVLGAVVVGTVVGAPPGSSRVTVNVT